MKKTSKKLLSFVLAVVMIVTSCSVGFTAFAEDTSPTNAYWNNTTKSDDAFNAINDLIDAYVPNILGIEIDKEAKKTIGSLLGMSKDDIKKATLQEVVASASPLLLGVLGGDEQDVKTFLIKHTAQTGITEQTWKNKYLKYYSYLDGTGNNTMSFYDLYTFCENNKNNSDEGFAKYCTETLDKLNILLQICSAAENEYNTKVSAADTAYNNLRNAVTAAKIKDGIKVSEVAEIEYNGTKIKDLKDDPNEADDTKKVYANGIQFCNDALEAAGVSFRATNPAEALMYYYVLPTGYAYTLNGANANSKGISFAAALLYAKLAKDGGKEIAGVTIPTEKTDEPIAFAVDTYAKLFDTNGTVTIAANRNYDTFCSSSFEAINKGILLMTGEYADMAAVDAAISKAKITDAQLEELKAHAVEGQYAILYEYINSSECTLSSYAKTMLNAIYTAQTNRSDFSMLNNEIAAGVENAKNYKSTISNYKTWGQMRNGGEEMPVIALINDIISGVMTKTDIASGTNIASANIVSKPFFDVLEANKFNTAIKSKTNGNEYDYNKFAVPGEYAVLAVNDALNNTIGGILDPNTETGAMVAPIISGFLETDLTLYDSNGKGIVNDIWKNLYNEPVQTIFNLLPVLAILVDEVVAPMLLTEGDGKLDALIDDPTTLLGQFALKANNTNVGLTALHFDLNKLLPSTLAWLNGDEETAKKLVKTYGEYVDENNITVDTSKWVDKDGKAPEKDTQPALNRNVYMFTGVYVADNLIYGLKGLTTLNDTLYNSLVDSKKKKNQEATSKDHIERTITEDELKSFKALATGITEAITEIANFANISVKDYLANDTYANEQRYGIDYTSPTQKTQSGLNNIFVAFPRLVDSIGKQFIKKYKINSDWTTVYNGKYVTKDKTFTDGTVTQTYNATLENFKALVNDKNSAAVLEALVNIIIGNWVDSFLDIANDTMSTNNELTNKIPLIQGLLNSLGGFGEKSIITDLLNGLFDLTRDSKASFTLTENSKTGYVGFSVESGIFLLANLQYKDNAGVLKGIIPLIMDIVASMQSETTETPAPEAQQPAATPEAQQPAPTEPPYVPTTLKTGTNYKELLSKSNVKAADELITKLDKILKSLLANTSINEFTLTSNDNILAGVLTTVANYLGQDNTNAIIKLLDSYVEVFNVPAVKGKVSANDVYTNANLNKIVIDTYVLIENIVDYLFYNEQSGFLTKGDKNKVIAGAVTGIVSPDSLSVRMSADYKAAAKDLSGIASWKNVKTISFGVKTGDKTDFYNAMGESLSGIAAILSAVLTASYTNASRTDNIYSKVVYPVLNTVAKHVNVTSVMTPADFNAATPQKQLVAGIITPLSDVISKLYNKPATFIINLVGAVAEVVEDESFKAIIAGVEEVVDSTINGTLSVVSDKNALNAPSLIKFLNNLIASKVSAFKANADESQINLSISLPSDTNILVNIINKALGDKFTLPIINWTKLATATPAQALLLIYGYVVDTLLGSSLIKDLIKGQAPEIVALVENLSAAEILTLLKDILNLTQSPTEAYWTFKEYASSLTGKFVYPRGITAADANEAVDNIDTLVQNIFPLLNSLGVTDIESLEGLVNDKLFTNEILTTIAKAAYGAIEGLLDKNKLTDTVKDLGIDLSTKGIAEYLMDKSYGNTYSSAANTLKKTSKWSKVTKINWGFTNGSAKAETGFINALAAMLRPANDLLAIFLVEGKDLNLDILNEDVQVELVSLIKGLNVGPMELTEIKGENGCKISLQIKKGILTLTVDSAMSAQNAVVKCDLAKIVSDALKAIGDVSVKLGTNGYESAIIPILEAFICKDVKTYKQYVADYKKAKDNLLINVLKPIFGLVDDVLASPANTLTSILPNVAYFIDSNGLAQAVGNLLAPVTSKNGLVGILKKHGINIDSLIKAIAGKDLGKVITSALKINVKLTLNISDLSTCNIQDIIMPLVKKLLADKKIGIKIPDFTFATIASHGTIKTVASAAKNAEGKYTTKRVVADKGEVLVAVLRFVAQTVIDNATFIKNLVCNIDAIKKNKTIKQIISSVFESIRVADKDDIVRILFVIISDNGYKDSFFDYRDFKTENYDFTFGDMDEEFCRKLAPMLDGLVSGLLADKGGLLGLLGGMIYTDNIVSTISTALYGAIEGVKIDKVGSLTNILKIADIDFTTANVAALLTNEDYGKTYPAVAATIKNAGSWARVNKDSLKWNVTDRDSFIDALCAALRPLYGVLDVLLNDGKLQLLDSLSIKGSDGYTSFIVPLLEAFGVYNIKTQYQYREDMSKAYDAILIDILNPLLDKVEDILNAPIEMLMDILPNLSLFFANNGLLQLIDNLLTPVSAILEALKPIVNVNDILDAVGLDISGLLKKIGVSANVKLDVYDLKATLLPVIGSDKVVSLLNGILGIIKIKGTPLGLELPEINWFQLASHGEYYNATSQVAAFGNRIAVKADQDETLIAVLRYLINTINYKNNYDTIVNLITGLLGDGVSDSISGVIDQVLGMVKGDADTVIKELVDLLQSIAG